MSEAIEDLKNNQRQLDEEGVFVGVSRQALVETLDEIAEFEELLTEIAEVAHHGALLGYTSEAEAMRQVRILTLSHWDKDECTRLQSEAAK